MPVHRFKVVHLDDERGFGTILCELLRNDGFEAWYIFSKVEGLDWVRKYQPDLIISDIMSPWLNGIDFLKALKRDERTSRIPFIFVTGYSGVEVEREAIRLGANHFMAKPIELAALEQLMWRVLTEREQSEDEREHSAVSFIQKPHGLEFADWPEVAGMFYRLVAKFARRVTIVKEHTDWKFDFLFEHRGSLFGGMFWRPVEFGALAYEEIMAFRDRLDEDGLDYGMMAGFYACDEEKKNFGRMLGIEIVSQEATGRLLNAAAGDPAGSRHHFLVQELRIPVGVLAESKKVLSFLNDAWAKIREEEGKCVYPERTRLVNNQMVNLPGFLESVGSTYLRIAEKGQLIGTYISKVDVWKALMKLWQGKSLTRKTLPVPKYEADDLFGLLSHLPHTTGTRNQIRLLSSARK